MNIIKIPAKPSKPVFHKRENTLKKVACLCTEHIFTLLSMSRQLSSPQF